MVKIIQNKFLIGKEEFYPFAAEMHYFRVNKKYWSVCFERMRKAGFRIISTAVPWGLHESPQGSFDFQGITDSRKDLVVFLELAREFGFKVILRPGPAIDSQWENRGYPDFVVQRSEILAQDASNQPVKSRDGVGINRGSVPSYLHPKFLSLVKSYLSTLSEVIKNYVYPKGPVFLIQLDSKLSFGGNDGAFQADYNETILKEEYHKFLKERYSSIKKLNSIYKEKNKDFPEVKPPRELKVKTKEELHKYWDWFLFKEQYLGKYLAYLQEVYTAQEIGAVFYTNFAQNENLFYPVNWQDLEKYSILLGQEVCWQGSYHRLCRHLRYLSYLTPFSLASDFYNGSPTATPLESKKHFPIGGKATKFLLTLASGCGVKGFQHYMFVEREGWYDSALANDGTIQESYEVIKRFNYLPEKIKLENLKNLQQVGLAYYRPYLQFLSLQSKQIFPYLFWLWEKTHLGVSADLAYLKYDYFLPDLKHKASLQNAKILLVPVAEFMEASVQQELVNLARSGKTLILFGLLPQYDLVSTESGKCEILSKLLGVRTRPETVIGEIKIADQTFCSLLYGYIKTAGRKSKVIARANGKPVGIFSKIKKGGIYLFTFDLSSELNPVKLLFLESLLKSVKVSPFGCTSDLQVDVIIQKDKENTVVYLLNTEGNFFGRDSSSYLLTESASEKTSIPAPKPVRKKTFILKLDCKRLGIRGQKLKLVDLLGEEVIKTSATELCQGIMLELSEMDSRMFLIEK